MGVNSVEFVTLFTVGVAGERQCAVLDPGWGQDLKHSISELLGLSSPAPGNTLVDDAPETPFLIGMTSGTTSVAKAFTRSRGSWTASFESSIKFFDLRKEDRTLAPGSLAASMNLYALAECLYAGSAFHTLESFNVGDAHASISHDGITRLVVVPTALRLLSERGLQGGVDASGIRVIVCAGSKLDARTLQAARRWAPNATIFEYYGASKLSFVAGAGLVPGQTMESRGTRIGKPFPGVEIRILNDAGRKSWHRKK